MSRILVLGATGTIGGQVATQLLSTDPTVRVGARTPSKAQALADAGAEVVHFDYDDPATWGPALAEVERLFVVAPMTPTFSEPVTRLVEAAEQAGVRSVVKLSAMGADVEAPIALARQHGLGDRAVRRSGLTHTVLQPSFFMDNIFDFHGHTITSDGAFYGASHGGAVSYVSSADIAAVAVAALTEPAAHDGQTYLITGGEALTDDQVAEAVSAQLGKPVRYVDLSGEQLAEGMRSNGLPAFLVEALVGLEHVKAQGWASQVSPVVAEVLGRPPETFAAFLARTQG